MFYRISTVNYFDFYALPISFDLDEAALRQLFLKKSKQYHPDFYTLESDEKQAEILELSTQNNEAYKLLKNRDQRLKYVLELKGLLGDPKTNALPQSFLMEMMEVNEQVMELQFDYDAAAHEQLKQDLTKEEAALRATVQALLEQYDDKTASKEDLLAIRDYYYKNQYLKRLKENINSIGA
ncbi:MAG: Fe-S protein assembly co-chaperone HscB [Aureispira sp.]